MHKITTNLWNIVEILYTCVYWFNVWENNVEFLFDVVTGIIRRHNEFKLMFKTYFASWKIIFAHWLKNISFLAEKIARFENISPEHYERKNANC